MPRTTKKAATARRMPRRLSVTVTLDLKSKDVTTTRSTDFDDNVELFILRAAYLKVMEAALKSMPQPVVAAMPRGGKTASGLFLPNTETVAAVNHPELLEVAK